MTVSTLTLRQTKGARLTTVEMDNNWLYCSDSSNATFAQSGTAPTYGWATRTVQAKAGDLLCVKDVKCADGHAVAGDASHDDTTGIQAAIDYLNSVGGGTLWFPRGNYLISASLNLPSYNNVYLLGYGPNGTQITATGDGVAIFNITGASAHIGIAGFWLGSFAARSATTGILVNGTSVANPSYEIIVRDITVQNLNAPIALTNASRVRIDNFNIIQSIASAVTSPGVHLTACVDVFIRNGAVFPTASSLGSDYVRVDGDCDTITLQNLNCALGASGRGYYFLVGAGTTGPRLVRVLNCYAENATLQGFYVTGGRDIRFDGCHAAVNSDNGFDFAGGDSIVAQNCLAVQNNSHGFFVEGGTGTAILNCTSSNNSQGTTNTYDGIRVENNVTHCRVIGNRSGDFIFSLTNKQRYGLSIGSTSTDYIVGKGNDLQGNNTDGMGNFSTGTNNDLDYENTFTGTLTGFTTTITGTVRYQRRGRIATLYVPLLTGTSNTTACTMTGMPTDVRPTRAQEMLVAITDSGTNAVGWASIATTGVITLAPTVANNAAGWTNSGTKALRLQTITYPLD